MSLAFRKNAIATACWRVWVFDAIALTGIITEL
jgi:hypothetical protein